MWLNMRGFVMTDGDKIKLRAELAGKAMQGLLVAGNDYDGFVVDRHSPAAELAERAVDYADALMKELGLDGE